MMAAALSFPPNVIRSAAALDTRSPKRRHKRFPLTGERGSASPQLGGRWGGRMEPDASLNLPVTQTERQIWGAGGIINKRRDLCFRPRQKDAFMLFQALAIPAMLPPLLASFCSVTPPTTPSTPA